MNLPATDKWILQGGKYVEDGVLEAIKDSSFQHPCLSYILDLADLIWENYFASEEYQEVKNHNTIKLPTIENNLQAYIDSYDNSDLNTAAEYCAFASKQFLSFDDSFEKLWMKESIINAAEVFGDAEALKMKDLSEDDLLQCGEKPDEANQ